MLAPRCIGPPRGQNLRGRKAPVTAAEHLPAFRRFGHSASELLPLLGLVREHPPLAVPLVRVLGGLRKRRNDLLGVRVNQLRFVLEHGKPPEALRWCGIALAHACDSDQVPRSRSRMGQIFTQPSPPELNSREPSADTASPKTPPRCQSNTARRARVFGSKTNTFPCSVPAKTASPFGSTAKTPIWSFVPPARFVPASQPVASSFPLLVS